MFMQRVSWLFLKQNQREQKKNDHPYSSMKKKLNDANLWRSFLWSFYCQLNTKGECSSLYQQICFFFLHKCVARNKNGTGRIGLEKCNLKKKDLKNVSWICVVCKISQWKFNLPSYLHPKNYLFLLYFAEFIHPNPFLFSSIQTNEL